MNEKCIPISGPGWFWGKGYLIFRIVSHPSSKLAKAGYRADKEKQANKKD
jgi:hypothetical protein